MPSQVGADDAADLRRVVPRVFGRRQVEGRLFHGVQRRHHGAGGPQRIDVVLGEIVRHPRQPRVDVGAAELFSRDLLSGGRLHERRAAEENGPGALDDDGLVGHRRHIGAPGGARPHHHRDLRHPFGRQARLVEEDAAEVLAVREYLRLHRQKRAAGVHEIETREPVFQRHLLRPQMLLDGDRVVGAAFHRRVVGDHHHFTTRDAPDAGDEPGAWRGVVVHAAGRQRRELEERRIRVQQMRETVTHRQLALVALALGRLLASAGARAFEACLEVAFQPAHRLLTGAEVVARGVDVGRQDTHWKSALRGQEAGGRKQENSALIREQKAFRPAFERPQPTADEQRSAHHPQQSVLYPLYRTQFFGHRLTLRRPA